MEPFLNKDCEINGYLPFQLGFGLHVVQKKTSVVYWSIAKGNEGFGLHSRLSTQPSRIANLFMKLRSLVLEMIVFRLQRFKTLRGVMVHHQNCVFLNNSQVLVREKPSFKFKVANRLVTGRRLFSLFFPLSQISRISSLGSVMLTAKSTLDLRAERCESRSSSSCRKRQESNNKKSG